MLSAMLPMAMSILFPNSAPVPQGGPVREYTDDNLFAGIAPKVGDPYAELMELSAEVERVANYDFGGPFERDMERARDQFDLTMSRIPTGGPLDSIISTFGAATNKSVGTLGDAVKRLGVQVANEVKRIDARINNIDIKNRAQDSAQTSLRQMVARMDQAWRSQFGTESRWRQAALFVVNQIPGLRAYDIVSSAEIIALYKYLAAVVKDAEDYDLGAAALTTPAAVGATFVQADVQAIITALANNIKAVNGVVGDICTYLGERAEVADDLKLSAALTRLEQFAQKDIFGQLGAIAPGQLEDRERAGVEMAGKFLLGGARTPGQSLFSF